MSELSDQADSSDAPAERAEEADADGEHHIAGPRDLQRGEEQQRGRLSVTRRRVARERRGREGRGRGERRG